MGTFTFQTATRINQLLAHYRREGGWADIIPFMKHRFPCVAMFVVAAPVLLPAADMVEGSLTANGQVVPLRSVLVEPSLGEVTLLMTEEPLPAGCGVYDVFSLTPEHPVRGMAVTLSKDTRQIEKAGINVLFHESWDGRLGTVGQPEIQIEQFDENVLKGSLQVAEGSLGDDKFAYQVRFEAGLVTKRAPIDATVTGAGKSAAAQAYVAYYRAMMAGQIEEGKKYAITEDADQITGDNIELFLEFFQDGHPREAAITAVEESGDAAKLTVTGELGTCLETDTGTAAVEMVKDSGGWKVKSESWEF